MTPDQPRNFPALILHSSVVFPDDVVSIQLPDDSLRTDVFALHGEDTLVATVYLRGDGGEPESVDDLRPVGVLCRVVQRSLDWIISGQEVIAS